MTITEWMQHSQSQLTAAHISSARLDCLVLLEDCLNTDRAQLLAHSDRELADEQISWLQQRIERRAGHEPLAYIRGKAPFYGREFSVNNHVLVPRPETEAMIELAKKSVSNRGIRIADIGTGSGCIAITLSLELNNAAVDAYDIDENALQVARQNAAALGANVTFRRSDLLADIADSCDALCANLPYVPVGGAENEDIYHEPSLALFAGADGLDCYREFWRQVASLRHKPSYIFTESLPPQHAELAQLAASTGYTLHATEHLIQVFSLHA